MSSTNQAPVLCLLSALKDVPALVEFYVGIVDEVMRQHGFDMEKCKFVSVHQSGHPRGRLHSVKAVSVEEDHALALAG